MEHRNSINHKFSLTLFLLIYEGSERMFAMIYTELDHKIGEKEKYFGPFTSYSSLKTFILPSEKKVLDKSTNWFSFLTES